MSKLQVNDSALSEKKVPLKDLDPLHAFIDGDGDRCILLETIEEKNKAHCIVCPLGGEPFLYDHDLDQDVHETDATLVFGKKD